MKTHTRKPRRSIQNVAIVGAGVMGRAIAIACAIAGVRVALVDINKDILKKALDKTRETADRLSLLHGIANAEGVMERVRAETSFKLAAEAAQIVIESVPEDLELKKRVFASLDSVADDELVLATNTSGLSITEIASSSRRPQNVVGIHFFAPAYILKTVEIVRGLRTSDRTVKIASEFAKLIGKEAILVQKDTRNFLVNSIQFAMIREAKKLLRKGVVESIEEVDRALMNSFAIRQATFGLFLDSDLVSPYSTITHEGRQGTYTYYKYGQNPEELMAIRDESLARLVAALDELRISQKISKSPIGLTKIRQ
jgi:3-hydroxyacyl-CoA dehydrogenase